MEKWSLTELLEAYFEHMYYDNPEDVELRGYEKHEGKAGGEYYDIPEDPLFNKFEKLCGEGKFEEVYKLINEGFEDLTWIQDFEGAIIERAEKKMSEDSPAKENYLDKMGIERI